MAPLHKGRSRRLDVCRRVNRPPGFSDEAARRKNGHVDMVGTSSAISELRAEIERIRRTGYATAFNESLVGTNSLAAPILGPGQVLRGTVAVIDSVQFLPQQPSKNHVARVMAAARQITKLLGGETVDVRVASARA